MSEIVLWNDEKQRYEKWTVHRDGVDIKAIGGEK